MKLGLFHFQLLYNVLENIHFIHDESELANAVLSNMAEALNAEAGSIFKIMPDGAIVPLASYGAPLASLKKMKFSIGKGVIGWVAEYAQPVKVDDPKKDARFMGTIDTNTGFKTRSIVAAPILTKGRPVGVIEFLNRKDGPFASPDLELISMVGREIGIAFENVRLLQNIENNRAFQEAILNSFSAGVLVADQQNKLIKMNPRAKEILALDLEDEAINARPPVPTVLAGIPQLAAVMKQSDTAVTSRQELSARVKERDITIGYSKVPVIGKDGACLGSALLFQDITSFRPPAMPSKQ